MAGKGKYVCRIPVRKIIRSRCRSLLLPKLAPALSIALILFCPVIVQAQAPSVRWAIRAGGYSEDVGTHLAADGIGNVYVTGNFSGLATFGETTLTSRGESDIFVAKYDSAGNVVWVRQTGGKDNEVGLDIAVDASGNAFVTYGGRPSSATGLSDVFVSKYSGSGAVRWSQQFGGSGADFGHGIATDPSGALYVTGRFLGTGQFGPATLQSRGSSDIYVVKLGGPPDLGIRRAANHLVISWPADEVGFVLQRTADLGVDPTWTDVPQAPSVVGSQNTVTVEASGERQFFRLRQF